MLKKQSSAYLLENLESRLLFSADVLPLPIDGGAHNSEIGSTLEVALRPAGESALEASSYVRSRLEVVFIDAGIDDHQELIDSLRSSFGDAKLFETVLIDSDRDGIEQISRALSQMQNVSAVHILSHGSDGEIILGNSLLNANTLDQYAETIEGWQRSLSDQADLLFYGCNLAQGDAGLELIDNLQILTGADIAASDDVTGQAELGGDWQLEYQAGNVETDVALDAAVQQQWNGVLAVGIDNTSTGTTTTADLNVMHATSGSDRLMLVGVSLDHSLESVSSITYNGVNLSVVGTEYVNDAAVEIWQLVAPDTGNHNLHVNFTGAIGDGATVGVMTFTGVDQTTPLGTFAADSGGSGSPTVNVSSAADELVFSTVAIEDSVDRNLSTSQDERWDLFTTGRSCNGGGSTEPGAASVTMSWGDSSGNNWAIGGVSIKPAVNDQPIARDDRAGLSFDGNDDIVVIADDPRLQMSSAMTMEAWINHSGIGTGSQIILNKEGEYELGITPDTGEIKWSFDNIDPDWNWHETGYFVTPNQWTHIAVTYDSGVVKTYANGELMETYSGSGNIADAYPALNDLYIGGRQNAADQRFNGEIDQVRIWNDVRSQAEILANIDQQLTGGEAGLAGAWNFNEGTGTTAADKTVNGNDGVLGGGVAAQEPVWVRYVVDEDSTLNIDWVNTAWSARQILTINNAAQAQTLTDSPVLVTLNSGNIDYTKTQDAGQDLRFYDANGTLLAHEIEQWNESGNSTVWVKVPQIAGATTTDITMYYGNAGASDGQDPTNVWDANYTGVWHLNETVTDEQTTGVHLTSTVTSGIDGTQQNNDDDPTSQIAIGQSFDGDDHIDFGTDASLNVGSADFTIEAWFNSAVGGNGTIVSNGAISTNGTRYLIAFTPEVNPNEIKFEIDDNTTKKAVFSTTGIDYADGNWHYAVGVRDGNSLRLYIDGVETTNGPTDITGYGNIDSAKPMTVGSTYNEVSGLPHDYFTGSIDEVRLSDRVRTADEIAAQNLSMRNSFVSFGGEEIAPSTGGVLHNDTDPDADPLSVTEVNGNAADVGNPVLLASGALLTLNADGSFFYDPSGAFESLASGESTTDSFTYTADDGNTGTDTATAVITIIGANDAPVLGAIGNQTVDELAALSFTASATDVDLPADNLSFSLDATSLAAGMTIDANTGDFSWTPTEGQGGVHSVTVTVTDDGTGNLTDFETFNITVNEVNVNPVLGAIGNQTIDELTTLSFTATATDSDLPVNNLTFSLDATSLAAGMTIDGSSGAFSWTPTEGQSGVHSVTVTVTDDGTGNLTDSETFNITVNEVNVNPVLGAIGNQAVDELTNLSFTATATDSDLPVNNLSFSLDATSLAAGMTIDGNSGAFSWTPTEGQGGVHSVTITVTDDGTGTLTDFETFNITVNEVNVPPVLGAIGNQTIDELTNLSFTATATDSDVPVDNLSFSLDATSLAAGMTINANSGAFSWTPTENQGGVHTVTVTVTDDGTGTLTDNETFTITVGEVNVPPVLGAIGNQTINELTNLSFTATATDSDVPVNNLSFSLDATSLAAGMTINANSGAFSWTPTENQGGVHTVTVTVTDDGTGTLTDSETFTITVGEVNVPPVLGVIGNQTIDELTNLSFTATATDSDVPVNNLTFSLDATSLAAGMTINANSGAFSWTPTENQSGVHSVTVTVTDDGTGTLTDSETFTITVGEVNVPPVLGVIGNQTIDENNNLSFTATATDSDLPANNLTFSLDATSLAAGMTIDGNSGAFSWTPNDGQNGVHSVTITVTDDGTGNLTDSETFNITVNAINDAPVLSAANNLSGINRNPTSNPGTLVANLISGQVSDVDVGALAGIAVTAVDNTNGAWEFSTNGGISWNAFGAPDSSSARLLAADIDTYVRFVPDVNWSGTVTNGITFRAWDQTSGVAGNTANTVPNGTTTAFSAAAASASITVTASNTAPTLSGANNLTGIDEDPVTNPGTLVSMLIAGQTSDPDSGALTGIAVTAVDNTNGTWQYSLNGGGIWNNFGSPDVASARLLAADIDTYVRFVPSANWNGTVTNGITFRAWDQTTGSAGGTADTTGESGTFLDQFSVQSYSNNDGSLIWSGPWVENDSSGGGASGGRIEINSNQLQFSVANAGDYIYREADLSSAQNATLSFSYDNGLGLSVLLHVQASGNGGASYTTLPGGVFDASTNQGTGNASIDLSGYIAADTRIRFLVLSGHASSIHNSLNIDNVQIAMTGGHGGTTAFSTATGSSSITVNAVNDAPVLGAIGNQTVDELTNLSFTATSTDIDVPADNLTFSLDATSLAAGMTIDANSGDFSWTPTEAQSGGHSVTITVADDGTGTLTDSETFAITVNEVNVNPVLGAIGNQTVDELTNLSFTATATDTDLPANNLTFSLDATSLAAGMTIDANTGDFSWTPTEAQGGGHTVTITVTDDGTGTLTDSETFTITVNEVNVPPVLGVIGNQTIDELTNLSFTATATDSDVPADNLTFSLDATSLAAGMTIDANSGDFSWTPTEAQSGVHSVTITVTDDGTGTLTDSETFTITVNEVNVAPVLGAIGNQTVDELTSLTFTATATDSDLPANNLTFSLDATSLAAGMTIDANSGGFSWTPTENQGGVHTVTVTVTDDGTGTLTDSETFTITVGEVNVPPVLGAIGNQTVDELTPLSFTATATDSDLPADNLTFSLDATSLAAGMTIDANTGDFSWTPTEGQSGVHSVTITVTDDGTGNLTDSETFNITVGEVNVPPVLGVIGNQTIDELTNLSFTATATDSDVPVDNLSFSLDATSLAAGMTIDGNTGDFSWTPTEGQGGVHSVTITVTDDGTGNLTDSETFNITVNEVNVAPVLGAIGNQTVDELTTLSFTATATDSDLPADNLTFSLDATSLAAGMTIDANTGDFSWTPTEGQGGVYSVTITVTDDGTGNLTDSETFNITVNEVNVAPVLGAIGNQTVDELTNLSFTATATDSDLPVDNLTYSLDATSLAAGMTIDANTGDFSWTPTEGQGGVHSVTITVTDDGTGNLTDSEIFNITVNEVNLPPVLGAIGNQTVDELTNLSFTATATDSDLPADNLTFSLDATSLAAGMTIDANTGDFSWTPTEGQGGVHSVTITVTDDGTGKLTDSETFNITVNEVNVPPVLGAIGNQTVDELTNLSFTATATDSDLPVDNLSFSLDAASLALGMTIDANTGDFSWTPTEGQSGVHSVTVTVADDGSGNLTDSETFNITVNEVNVAPVLGAIGNQTVDELTSLAFTATAIDSDLPVDNLSFSVDATSLAAGMTIDANTGDFSWTPTENQGGVHSVTVTVTDDGSGNLTDSETFTITVNEVNVAPVLGAIGNQTVNELTNLSFTATATDSDLPADNLTFSLDATSLAAGMTIDANTGDFSWTPTEAQGGVHSVTVTVTDDGTGALTDSETFTITVNEVNVAPVLGAIGNQTVDELTTLSFTATATDSDVPVDNLTFSLDATSLAAGMTIDANTGDFSWTPTENQGGVHSVTVTVTDDGSGNLTDSETFTITVNEVNVAPVLGAIGNQTVDELTTLAFTATAIDSDLPVDNLSFSVDATSLAAGMTIDANTGDFSWTATEGQSGVHSVTVTVTDDGSGSLTDSETFTITVNEVNVAPVLGAIGNQTVNELTNLSFTATATDSDLPADNLTFSLDATSLAAGMTIDANTGDFSWTPTEAQGGVHSVTVTVTDDGTGNLTDSETFTITVNEVNVAPVLGAIGNQTVDELTTLNFTATAIDSDLPVDNLSFSLDATSLAAGMTIDANSGAFSWTPTEGQGGVHSVTVTVTDDGTGTLADSETLNITVNEVNVAPVLGAIGNQTLDELTNLSFTATATDSDLPVNNLTFSLDATSLAAGMTIDANSGAFSWTPAEGQGGVHSVTITVADDGTGNLTDSETFNITVNEVNVAPVLSAIGNQTVDELINLSFTATATDSDLPADNLTFSLDATSLAAGMTIDATSGAFSWTPTEGQGGVHSVTITVIDDGSGNLTDSETFTITVNEVNVNPVLSAIGNQTMDELTNLSFTATATDSDLPANNLTFSLDATSLAAGMTIDANTGDFNWTPTENQGGVHNVTITVTDDGSGNLTDSETFTITVNEVNVAPVLGTIGNQTVDELTNLSFTAMATDIDVPANNLSFSLDATSLAAGMTIDATSGAFSWTPTESQGGVHSVTITVTDNGTGNLSDSETFTITVNEVNVAPILGAIGNQTVDELTTLSFTATATDSDLPADTLTYSLDAASIALGMSIDANTGVFSWTPSEAQGGLTPSVTISVTDSGTSTLTDSETFTITVNDINIAPTTSLVTLTAIAEDSGPRLITQAELLANANDLDGDPLTATTLVISSGLGSLVDNGDGTWSYTPAADDDTSVSFSYLIDDGTDTVTGSATLDIVPVNDAPITLGIADFSVPEDSSDSFVDLDAAFSDVDNSDAELNYAITGITNIGLFSGTSIDAITGLLRLEYAVDMNGTSQLTVRATDPSGTSVDTVFTVTVTPVNDAPVITTNTGTVVNSVAATVITTNELNVTDIDNTAAEVVFTVTALPGGGVLMLDGVVLGLNDTFTAADLANNKLTYQPTGTGAPDDHFKFTVADGSGGGIAESRFTITLQINTEDRTDDSEPAEDTDAAPEDEQTDDPVNEVTPEVEEIVQTAEVATDETIRFAILNDTAGFHPMKEFIRLSLPEFIVNYQEFMPKSDEVMETLMSPQVAFTQLQQLSMDALWGALESMKTGIDENIREIEIFDIKVDPAKATGAALTAGIVAWVLRSGALMASLISTIPLWKGYDPLPILVSRDDDEDGGEDDKLDEMFEDENTAD